MEERRPGRRAHAGEFDVVAIGASAGGVEALQTLVGALPEGFPAATLIVLHVDPSHKSTLAGLLGRRTSAPVRQARDGDRIEQGVIYIAPPATHLLVRDHALRLTDTARVHYSRPSIDILFESVAEQYGDRAIAVILSGSGVDGAAGVRAIKTRGGTTIAQSSTSATHASMPDAARATGCVDLTLPLAEIGPVLVRLVAPGSREDLAARDDG